MFVEVGAVLLFSMYSVCTWNSMLKKAQNNNVFVTEIIYLYRMLKSLIKKNVTKFIFFKIYLHDKKN